MIIQTESLHVPKLMVFGETGCLCGLEDDDVLLSVHVSEPSELVAFIGLASVNFELNLAATPPLSY